MNWHAQLSARLDKIEASTRQIKAHLVRFIAQESGQTEAQVWAWLVERQEQQRTHSLN